MSAAPVSRDTTYAALKEYVIQATGLAYYQSRDKDFEDRIDRRLRLLSITSYGTYLTLLHDSVLGPAELDHLIAELTIGETFFFRDEQQFDVLRELIVPDLLRRDRPRKSLRVWSAGCASGAEPYSLSIVLRDEFRAQTGDWEISILGTDINRRLLAQAQNGSYEKWALRSTPEDIRERCFHHEGNHWRIADRYRRGVGFQYHNLVKDRAPSWLNSVFAFDLIFCRNVMIYFDRPTAAAVVERLRGCLAEGAWLVVGHADHEPTVFRGFEVVSSNGISVYRKPGGAPTASHDRPQIALADLPQGLVFPADDLGSMPARTVPDFPGPSSNSAVDRLDPLARPSGSRPVTPTRECTDRSTPFIGDVRTLADAGAWAEAETLCVLLIEKGPLDPMPHFYQALILEQMSRIDEAERSLRRSVYLDRRFILAHYHLGLLLRRGGSRLGAARQCFENVLALLGGVEDEHVFEHGDGIRAADLRNLTEMNLEGL